MRSRQLRRFARLAAIAVAFAGCSDAARTNGPAPPPPPPESAGNSAGPPAGDTLSIQPSPSAGPKITLQDVDGDGFRAAVATHLGNVVLVDMWATWCGPCLEKFPHIVDLHRQHRDAGLAVISLSVDEPDARADVLQFLIEQHAEFDNLLGTYGVGTEAIDAFEYGGDVPFYKLYDRTGKLRYQFSGDPRDGIEPIEQLDHRVLELLAEPG
jgi:thiol-disulfide isomerase/thioredoxin